MMGMSASKEQEQISFPADTDKAYSEVQRSRRSSKLRCISLA